MDIKFITIINDEEKRNTFFNDVERVIKILRQNGNYEAVRVYNKALIKIKKSLYLYGVT